MTNPITRCSNSSECPYKARCLRAMASVHEDHDRADFYKSGEPCGHFMMPYPYPGGDAMT